MPCTEACHPFHDAMESSIHAQSAATLAHLLDVGPQVLALTVLRAKQLCHGVQLRAQAGTNNHAQKIVYSLGFRVQSLMHALNETHSVNIAWH